MLNYLLLYTMIDTRVLLSDKIISDFHTNESLLELIMTNWMDLISLKSMIHNVMVLRQPEFGGYYGIFRMTNQMFLNVLRIKLTARTLESLDMHSRSDGEILEDMRVLAGFFRGNSRKRDGFVTPRAEIGRETPTGCKCRILLTRRTRASEAKASSKTGRIWRTKWARNSTSRRGPKTLKSSRTETCIFPEILTRKL